MAFMGVMGGRGGSLFWSNGYGPMHWVVPITAAIKVGVEPCFQGGEAVPVHPIPGSCCLRELLDLDGSRHGRPRLRGGCGSHEPLMSLPGGRERCEGEGAR